MAALAKGYRSPIWMTFKQALGGAMRRGERGSLSVYADSITRTATDRESGEETEASMHFMKGYTVFNVEQIDGLPERYYASPTPRLEPLPRIVRAEEFFAATRADIRHGGNRAYYAQGSDHIQMPPFEAFHDPEATTPRWRMNAPTERKRRHASTANSGASAGAMKATPWRNSSPNSARPSCARALN